MFLKNLHYIIYKKAFRLLHSNENFFKNSIIGRIALLAHFAKFALYKCNIIANAAIFTLYLCG